MAAVAEPLAVCPFSGAQHPAYVATDACNYTVDLEAMLKEMMENQQDDVNQADAEGDDGVDANRSALGNKLRGAVSLKKKRFQHSGFDLDLTYITSRIVAMGFPSHGREALYRNPAEEVERFFDTRHRNGADRLYKVYNLCSEREYANKSIFGGSWERYPFDDHNPPCPITLVPEFCEDVAAWHARGSDHVVAVHCKAGKGRTGVMIVCYLMLTQPALRKAQAALDYFADKRTYDLEGVTIPSQHRFCHYWERILTDFGGKVPPVRPRRLVRLVIHTAIRPKAVENPQVTVRQGTPQGLGKEPVFDSRKPAQEIPFKGDQFELWFPGGGLVVFGEVKFQITDVGFLTDEPLFHFWIYTTFLEDHFELRKEALDKACKDKKGEYLSDLRIELFSETF
eukprot:TRINITY_DN904_c0_g1_i1.p1 TRINITY_DN904_c0_g1~~TRINITY_DN904_c0_g1_i1.p1  ORF type:complete len:396 (-),score=132.44 TRINITY_DN904_c0_g1_i1:70-1257(-)